MNEFNHSSTFIGEIITAGHVIKFERSRTSDSADLYYFFAKDKIIKMGNLICIKYIFCVLFLSC